MSFEISKNKCEICKQQAISGIIDTKDKIRYSCIDHYLQVYDRIKLEWMEDRLAQRTKYKGIKK